MASSAAYARRGSKCKFISQKFDDIRYSNDVLNKGLAELEALYLLIETRRIPDERIAKENAVILKGQNEYLAHAINSELKEVESILRQHVESGSPINKDTILEFSEVLKESIRILRDYQTIQEGYSSSLCETGSSSGSRTTIYFHGKYQRGSRNRRQKRKSPILRRIIQALCFCICGSGINFYNN